MKALIMKKGIDRVPVSPKATLYVAKVSGISSKEFYLDPKKSLQAQLWCRELHDYDGSPALNIPDWGGWDFGGKLHFPSSSKVSVPVLNNRPVKTEKDIEKLNIPDINTAPACSRMLAFARLATEKGFSVGFNGGSPLRIVESVLGLELMLRWFYKKPELIHRLLRLATDYILKIGEYYIKEFGAENCSVYTSYPLECHALVSPKIFEKFSLPYVKEIHEKLIDKGIKKWKIHLCGDHTYNLPYWTDEIKLVPRTIFTIGQEMDIESTAKILGENHIIGGNIPTTLFKMESPEKIFEESKKLLQKMKHHPGGFILMPDCALPASTPPVNVYAMIKAARMFGRYD
jgi:uroporphyrinogen decarboxylase